MIGAVYEYTIDLEKGLRSEVISKPLMTYDNNAHTFIFHLVQGDTLPNITDATAEAYFTFLGLDATLVIDAAVSGNDVTVTLPKECYSNHKDRYSLIVKLSHKGATMSIFAAVGEIQNSRSDAVYDPSGLGKSLEEALAELKDKINGFNQTVDDGTNKIAGMLKEVGDVNAKLDSYWNDVLVGTVTTVGPDQPAAVTTETTEDGKKINFVIPRGEKGERGAGGLDDGSPRTDAMWSSSKTSAEITTAKTTLEAAITQATANKANHVLWTGSSFMGANDTITLSEKVSDQRHGIVLLWSTYATSSNSPQNYNFNQFFVPKYTVETFPNCASTFFLAGYGLASVCAKYVYIADTTIKGHSTNNVSTKNANTNLTNASNGYVLRAVIGV